MDHQKKTIAFFTVEVTSVLTMVRVLVNPIRFFEAILRLWHEAVQPRFGKVTALLSSGTCNSSRSSTCAIRLTV
jgi:hypothetical protein